MAWRGGRHTCCCARRRALHDAAHGSTQHAPKMRSGSACIAFPVLLWVALLVPCNAPPSGRVVPPEPMGCYVPPPSSPSKPHQDSNYNPAGASMHSLPLREQSPPLPPTTHKHTAQRRTQPCAVAAHVGCYSHSASQPWIDTSSQQLHSPTSCTPTQCVC